MEPCEPPVGSPRRPPFGLGTSSPPKIRREEVTGVLRRLVGGPFAGKVAETSGRRPAILLGDARDETLLDDPAEEALWVPERRWYEVQA